LLRYFELVLKKDYTSVFGFDVASKLPESSIETIRKVIVVVKALAPEKIGHDVLGKVFHELIPFNIRKAVAAFYTNNEAAEILASLAIEKPDAKVMDLACGSGTLLVAAYRRKKELLQTGKGELSLEDHRRFLEHDLTGVDIMPFAAHLAVMHLSLQALLHETEKVRIAVWDSTELKPNMNIPAIESELKAAYRKPTLDMFKEKFVIPQDAYMKKGAVTLEGVGGEEIALEKVDLVIMNPPFTRQERLPKDYKIALQNRLREYKDKLNGRLGLHGYFVLLADRFVKTDGRVAFVLPATTLRITSTKGVRELLLDYELEHIVTTYQKAAFSEGAQFREILLLAKKTKSKRVSSCLFTFIKKLPNTVNEAKDIAFKLCELGNQLSLQETYISDNISSRKVDQNKLRKNSDNLFRYIACEDLRLVHIWETIEERGKSKLVPFSLALKNLGGRIVEGARARSHLLRSPIGSTFIVCDAERATKKNDLWIVKDTGKDTLTAENLIDHGLVQIPKKSLVFGLRRFSGISSMDLSNKLDYIVVDEFPAIETFFQSRDVKKILSDLPNWKKYISHRMAKLLVADRFDMSASGTKLLAWYTSMPMAGYSLVLNVTGLENEDAKIFTIWFNSTINALQIFLGRIETRGAWMAFRQYVMSSFMVIDPLGLPRSQRQKILRTFEDVKDAILPSFLEQLKQSHPIRRKIDELVLEIIGFEKAKIEVILKDLYPAFANEIEKLKTLMEG
jgi:tRNA1(Val) A37 N6-methylase TrmN6